MIYLIGGSPRGGKSILSKKLSKTLNIPYISTDNLRLVVLPYFKGKDKYKSFPFIKMYDSVSIDKFFQIYSRKKIFKADIREAKSIWPGVKSLIAHLIDCEMDYIIEGVHLLPILVKQFQKNKNFKIVFLAKLDEDKIYKGLLSHKHHGDWLIDNAKDNKTLLIAANSVRDYGKFFIKETKKYGLKCINTEDKFLDKINQAVEHMKN